MFALFVTSDTVASFTKRIQRFINRLISSSVTQLEGLPFELPTPKQIDWAVKTCAIRYGKTLRRAVNGGILIQRKESLSSQSELEAAMKVYVYFDDYTFTTLFVSSDDTLQEMPSPDRIADMNVRAQRVKA